MARGKQKQTTPTKAKLDKRSNKVEICKADYEKVLHMYEMRSTQGEIANFIGITVDTLKRWEKRHLKDVNTAKEKRPFKLREQMWQKAEEGDWNAMKFLANNFLGMSDKQEVSANNDIKISFTPFQEEVDND